MPPDDDMLLANSMGVSRETITRLHHYEAMLHKWQKALNLVSPATLPDAWRRHFIDSMQLYKHLPKSMPVLADLGCGGGFPGLVLAMLEPELQVHLIESDEKKCQFMRSVSRETETKVKIHTSRVEKGYDLVSPDIVTARALASLDKLLGYCQPWAQKNPRLVCFFMKGERAEEEILVARSLYDFQCELIRSETEPQAKILRISNIKAL